MIDADLLLAEARAAAGASYSPYSRFRVGAAVAAGGRVFRGCNVENASYGLAICAERSAVFAAVAAGERRIEAVAVACVDAAPDGPAGALMPCGACLQVLREFGDAAMAVHVDRAGSYALGELLPRPFVLE